MSIRPLFCALREQRDRAKILPPSPSAYYVRDPKQCRAHARRCSELAETASTPELMQTPSDLAETWGQLAVGSGTRARA